MKKYVAILAVIAALLLPGCRIGYSDEPLTGTIQGAEFIFVDGFIKSDGYAELFDQEKDFSLSSTQTEPYLTFQVPELAPAKYRLHIDWGNLINSFIVTGKAPGEAKLPYIMGHLEITEVTPTTVMGRMNIFGNGDSLNGVFTLERVDW